MKKIFTGVALIALMFSPGVLAMSAPKFPATLLVVPARYTIIQVANDVIARRPAVLIAYQREEDTLRMHVWNGGAWIPITPEDYKTTAFMKVTPARIVLVGDEDLTQRLSDMSGGHPQIESIEVMNVEGLLNKLGQTFAFSEDEWVWFAKRYGCNLKILNREEIEKSWYDQKGSEFRQKEQREKNALKNAAMLNTNGENAETIPEVTPDAPPKEPTTEIKTDDKTGNDDIAKETVKEIADEDKEK
jgi:hypothetical protein